MESQNTLSAEQSLALINETIANNRREVAKRNGAHFIYWGLFLLIISLSVSLLWKFTGNAYWNFLWFVMSVFGYPLMALIEKNKEKAPKTFVGSLLGYTWCTFGIVALLIFVLALFVKNVPLTMMIIMILGMAEAVSGAILKNGCIIITGIVTAVGGVFAASLLAHSPLQHLVFTAGGLILILTGIFVTKHSK